MTICGLGCRSKSPLKTSPTRCLCRNSSQPRSLYSSFTRHFASRERKNCMTTTATTLLHSSQRLRSFFEPQSIALVGASEKSTWSFFTHGNLRGRNYPGELYYVNPRSQTVHGQPTVARLADIGKPVDLAFVMVPPDVVPTIFQEMVAVGIRNAILL